MPNYLKERYKKGKRLVSVQMLSIFSISIMAFNFLAPIINIDNHVQAQINIDSLVELHNAERAKHNLGKLTINPQLNASAAAKAKAMLESNCWSHYCPDGKSPWDFFRDAKYDYLFAGENLAEGFFNNKDVMEAWLNSPTHRENIMSPNFTEIGFGFAEGKYQGQANNVIIVVHFGQPKTTQSFVNLDNNLKLSKPDILSPANSSYISSSNIDISGNAPLGSQVKLFLNGDRQFTTDAAQGIFTYKLNGLEEQKYTLTAQAVKGTQSSEYSDLVVFTIDRTPDPVALTDLIVQKTDHSTLQLHKIGLQNAYVTNSNQVIGFEKNPDGVWEINLATANLPLTNVEITSIDLAGNQSKTQIDLGTVTQFTPTTAPVLNISLQNSINIAALTIFVIVLAIDIYLMHKHRGPDVKLSNQHLHLGVLFILVLVMIMNSITGHILTGAKL